jgi:hypothetical protein
MAAIDPGEFGADLDILRRFYLAPRSPQESNHHFNLFGGARLYPTMLHHGLTNNRALVVLSHGKGIIWKGAVRYGYHPGNRVWQEETMPYFSAADIARVIGAAGASQIHNVLIAGCNKDQAFDASELRRCFVNATNITHAPGGRDGYELVFRHTVTHASSDICALYSMDESSLTRIARAHISFGGASYTSPPGAPPHSIGGASYTSPPTAPPHFIGGASYTSPPFVPYIAELYRPGEHTPFATRIAGRELLDPSVLNIAADLAAAHFREAAGEIAAAAQRKDSAVLSAGRQSRTASSSQSALNPAVSDPDSSEIIRWQTHTHNQRPATTSTTGVVRWNTGAGNK